MNGSPTARLLTQLWFLTVAVLAVAVLFLAKVLLLPLGIAVLFAFLLAPVVAQLERLRLPRPAAALIVIFGFSALLLVAAWTIFTQIVAIADDLPTYRDNITAKFEALHRPSNSAIGHVQHELEKLSNELGIMNATATAALQSPKKVQEKPIGTTPEHPLQVREVGRPTGRLDQLGGIVEPLTTVFLAVVFTFFVLLQREDLRNRLIRLSGDRNLSLMTQAMRDASQRISRYFLLQLAVNLVYGTVVCVALYFIGLPHALLFGALATLCRFVPYIGAPVAALTPTFLSVAVFHGWEHTVLILALFFVLEVVTANYAEPHIYGRHTGLSSLAVLIAAAFWTLIWGPVGLVLSVPLTVCLVVMGSHVPSLEFLTVLLGDQPAIPPYTCFYQRLLAHDEREASNLLFKMLSSEPLVTVYDSIVIPALTLVEKDRQQGDLDDSTMAFIRNTTGELVEELGFRATEEQAASESGQNASVNTADDEGGRIAEDQARRVDRVALASTGQTQRSHASDHGDSNRTVAVVVPVRDGADSLVATMLTQVLNLSGVNAVSLPVRAIHETVEAVAKQRPAIVFFSGMPPVAMARANRLYRSLRSGTGDEVRENPLRANATEKEGWNGNFRIVAGIWNLTDDPTRAAHMITRSEELHISTSLADAVAQAMSLAGDRPAVPEPLDASPQLVAAPKDTAA
ncbi:AI-2E family transporter [Occallatibacter savannae]|uniref:AI-2E family transporter n=1 Tax=Occallatibacter savannae TaxID=1002691 RepID=UPI000D695487|nr:AI-2E family transporter [Occallatibacter savannae]